MYGLYITNKMDFDNIHSDINKILNRTTNKKEENISDTYILASNKLRELYGNKTILFYKLDLFLKCMINIKIKKKGNYGFNINGRSM